MNAIVSVTEDWGIGLDGALVVRNRADMRRFVELTRPGTVVMGRRTLESFPGGRPLKGRRNVMLSRDPGFAPEGVEVARSVDEALALVAADDPDRVWLIGGEAVYAQLLGRCARAYVTLNHVVVPVDARFPDLDALPDWALESRDQAGTTDDGVPYEFLTYRNLAL